MVGAHRSCFASLSLYCWCSSIGVFFSARISRTPQLCMQLATPAPLVSEGRFPNVSEAIRSNHLQGKALRMDYSWGTAMLRVKHRENLSNLTRPSRQIGLSAQFVVYCVLRYSVNTIVHSPGLCRLPALHLTLYAPSTTRESRQKGFGTIMSSAEFAGLT